jgi:integrase
MPRPRFPHLQLETRNGHRDWYVRIGRGARYRIRGEYGSIEFLENYKIAHDAAITGRQPVRGGPAQGSLHWLIERYRETRAWQELSLATRRQRENIFKQVVQTAGMKPYSAITETTIIAGRDRRAKTPFQARHFLDTMRGLFAWACEAKFCRVNAAAKVKYPKLKTGAGFPVWTEEDVAAYEARWPLGTRQRVWLAVLLYTGMRRGDAVRLGRQHVRDGAATIEPEKTRERTRIKVTIPLLPPLLDALHAGPTGDLSYICGAAGKPLTKESFGNLFSDACRAAGVKKSAHGLRKIGATRAALNGATVAQLNAIFGWTGSKMASLYTQAADRERLAREAAHKLLNDSRTSIPAKEGVLRASGQKE